MHNNFGGELLVDGLVCFKDGVVVGDGFDLDPRDGEIQNNSGVAILKAQTSLTLIVADSS